MKLKQILLLLFIWMFWFETPSHGEKLQILTNEEPPMNFLDKKEVSGFSTEIVKELMKRLKLQQKVEILPWGRVYSFALSKPNIVLFTMGRIAKRENRFHWIAPLVEKRWVLYAKKSSKLKIRKLDDAKKYNIALLFNDARSHFLKDRGFKNVREVRSHVLALKMLMRSRGELWASSDMESPSIFKQTSYQLNNIESVYTLKTMQGYLAISKKTSPEIVKKWKAAFEELKKDGTIIRIGKRWAKILNAPISGSRGLIAFTTP